MSQTNYDAMTDAELKQYFLKHRGDPAGLRATVPDRAAFQAYLDRLNQRPRRIIARPDDPDFDQKVQAAIRQKLEASGKSSGRQSDHSDSAEP